MKRILVTGANGFVGRHVVQAFAGVAEVVQFNRTIWDLTKPVTSEIRKKIGEIDGVIHLAGLTQKSDDYFIQNVIGTINVLEIPVTYFLYVSTADVYGYPGNIITEETSTNPQTAYAVSKLAAEHMVRILCTQKNIPFCITRLANVYGPGEDAYQKAIPVFIRLASSGKPIQIFGSGNALRDYIYVTDVARALVDIIQHKRTGIFNIASGNSHSIKEVASLIHQLTLNEKAVEYVKSDKKETDMIFNTSKLTAIGFVPKISLADGLAKEIHLCKSFLI